MGDAATSIVRSFNNSQWVSTAGHWCYSATFYSRASPPSSPLHPYRSCPWCGPRGIRKRTGLGFEESLQRDRITRYFHVRWLNWNAIEDERRSPPLAAARGNGLLSAAVNGRRLN